MARRLKVVPAREVGYGSGWIVREWDHRCQLWFDVGDPVPTRAEAEEKMVEADREDTPGSHEG